MSRQHKSNGLGRKIKERWLMLLFGLPFAAVGAGFLLFAIVPTVSSWVEMKGWDQAQAYVQEAKLLVSRGSDSTTYKAQARYYYDYQGVRYFNTRVGLGDSFDNIGKFHQQMVRQLKSAKKNGSTITIWVDPTNPQNAVVSREIRWPLLLMKSIFIIIFGGVGFGIIAFSLIAPLAEIENANTRDKPWLSRREWASSQVKSTAKVGVVVLWVFTAVWLLISMPVAYFVLDDYRPGNKEVLVVLIFPVIGLALLLWAIKQTLSWRHFGVTPFVMDPYPGMVGGHVGGTIDLKAAYHSDVAFTVTLLCIYSYMSGSGKNRKRHERIVWQDQGFAYVVNHGNKVRLSILFETKDSLPSSEKPSNAYHLWRLKVESIGLQSEFNRSYEIPVFKTHQNNLQTARYINQLSAEHPQTQAYREKEIQSTLNIETVGDSVSIHCPAFKHPAGKLVGVLVGSIFLFAGVMISVYGDAMIFGSLFSIIGSIITIWTLYSLFLSIKVKINHSEIELIKTLLGIKISYKHVPRLQIKHMCLVNTMTAGTKEYFKIQAILDNGKKITMAHNLVGRGVARQAIQKISDLTKLKFLAGTDGI